jgi:hypothetical protein
VAADVDKEDFIFSEESEYYTGSRTDRENPQTFEVTEEFVRLQPLIEGILDENLEPVSKHQIIGGPSDAFLVSALEAA